MGESAEERGGETGRGRQDDDAAGGQMDADAFMRLSEGLRTAFVQVTGAKLGGGEGARWQRRLIAVTTLAKRDLAGALEMLERFERDWDARRR